MRAAQAAASAGVAMGFAGGAGLVTGAANFADASGAFGSIAASIATVTLLFRNQVSRASGIVEMTRKC